MRVPVFQMLDFRFKIAFHSNFYLFVVRVPVLSEHIVVAFPIVSQASRCRTKLLSLIIFYKKLFRARSIFSAKQLVHTHFEFVNMDIIKGVGLLKRLDYCAYYRSQLVL